MGLFLLAAAILSLFHFSVIAYAAKDAAPKRVLIIYSYHEGLPWERLLDDSLRATLASKSTEPIELNVEHSDRVRYPGDAHLQNFIDLLRHKYSHPKMDVVIGVEDDAVEILLKHGEELFPGVPIVFLSAERKTLQRDSLKPNMTSLLWGPDFQGTADLIYKMLPKTRQIFIVSGSSLGDRAAQNLARNTLRGGTNQLEFKYLADMTRKDLLQKVARLPENSAILYLQLSRDSEGKSFVPREILSDISRKANAPTFGIIDPYLGFGIVGGSLLSAEVQGRRCAEICLRIIGGKSPAGIVPEQTRNALTFDARQLKRWGISEATLPPDSIVRYRKLSVWQQYRWQAIGLIAFGLIQTLIIFLLWVQIKKRHHAETSARESEVKYRTVADFTYDWEYWANFDGKLHYVSPSCERISSYTAQEFIENPSLFREVIVPEDREIWDKHFQNSREELRQRELQFRIQRRDGKIRWIEHACQPVYDGQGNPSGFRASNRDITERKQSELALVESKTFNQTTLDSLKYHIAVLDQEGNVLDVNQSWLQFSHENDGGTSDRLGLGVNYLEVCRRSSIRGDDSAQAALEGIQSVIEGQSDHFELEYPCHSPTQKRWFLMRVTLFKGQQGRVIISHADITDRKLSEIDLQEAYTEIEQLKNQLEAETAYLQEEIKLEHDFESIISNSPAIQHVLFKVEQVADTDTTVLVLGEDLFYRLNVFPITVPPLRDRIEDIPLLVEFFVEKASKRLGKSIKVVPTSVMNTLKKYPWPGNVRELENVIERAVISSSGPKLRLVDELSPVKPDFAAPLKTMEAVEYDHIVQVLERTEWKVSGKNGAAEILGLKRGTLRARMQKLGIRKP